MNNSHIGKEIIAILDCPEKCFKMGDIKILLNTFECSCKRVLLDIGQSMNEQGIKCACGNCYNTSHNRLSYAESWMLLEDISISEFYEQLNKEQLIEEL